MNALIEQINSTGKTFIDFALPMLIQSSALIIILLALDMLLRKRIRAVFRYWIWMIVLVKLILPPSLSLPTSPAYWFGDKIINSAQNPPIQEEPVTYSFRNIEIALPTNDFTPTVYRPEPVFNSEVPVATPPVIPQTPLSWQAIVFLSWLTLSLIMLILLIQRTFFVKRLIKQSQNADEKLNNILEKARLQMSLKKKVVMRLSDTAMSPSVCGLFKPVILIPQKLVKTISSNDLKAILLHELAHIKRKDLWVNLVQAILQIIYIYNPLLWIANIIIRNIREQAVDEMVLVTMGEYAEDYPKTLLNISRLSFGSAALSLRLIGVAESKKALITRIKHITSRPFPKTVKLGITGLTAIILAAFVLLPMAKGQRQTNNPSEEIIDNLANDITDNISGQEPNDINESDSAKDEFKAKYSDVREFVKIGNITGYYDKCLEMFDKDDLPLLNELLKDEEYAPYRLNISRLIIHINNDHDSIESIKLDFSVNDIKKIVIEHQQEPPGSELKFVHQVESVQYDQFINAIAAGERKKVSEGELWLRQMQDPQIFILLQDGQEIEIWISRYEIRFCMRSKNGNIYFNSASLENLINEIVIDGLKSELNGNEWTNRRYQAASKLFDRGDTSGLDILVQSMNEDKPILTRVIAAGRLAKKQHPQAFQTLSELGISTTNDNYGQRVCSALLEYVGSEYDPFPIFKKICLESSWEKHETRVIQHLKKIGTHKAIETMIELWGRGEYYSTFLMQTCGQYFEPEDNKKCLEWWEKNKHRPVLELLADGVENDPKGSVSVFILQMQGLNPNGAIEVFIRRLPDARGDAVEYITGALRDLTNINFGTDKAAWQKWWEENKGNYAEHVEESGWSEAVDGEKQPTLSNQLRPTIILNDVNVPGGLNPVIYKDEYYSFYDRGYGNEGAPLVPGMFVFSHKHNKWKEIIKLSTERAKLGRSPRDTELAAGRNPAMLGWDYSNLSENDYAAMPLMTSGSVNFPNVIHFDKQTSEYFLRFNSSWNIEAVLTEFVVRKNDIDRAFNDTIETEKSWSEAVQPNILQEDMNAADFSNALLGSWKSAFTSLQGANIQQIHFFPDDTATLTVISNGRENTIAGKYRLEFEREPRQDMITLAKININSGSDTITLSRVNFGAHSGVILSKGPLLRIDNEPYGALERFIPGDSENINVIKNELPDNSTDANTREDSATEFGYENIEISGVIKDTSGNPIANAQVAFSNNEIGVLFKNGKLENGRYGDKSRIILTDSQGKFNLGEKPAGEFHLIAAHDKGFALAEFNDLSVTYKIQLEPWGRIEGQVAQSRIVAGNQINMFSLPNSSWFINQRDYQYETRCDMNGRFVFEKVPPGWFEVGYLILINNSASGSVTSRTPVQVKAGETSNMTLGGEGQPVTGKFVAPQGYNKTVSFMECVTSLQTVSPEQPRPDNYEQMTDEHKQLWYNQWRKSDQYKAYIEAYWHDKNWRCYSFFINDDGSFQIEDVIPGKYQFHVTLLKESGIEREAFGGYGGTIEVPQLQESYSDKPFDLGELELKMYDQIESEKTQSEITKQFTAALPNVVTVELLGVCEHPSEGKQWWRADGSKLEKAPYEKFDRIIEADESSKIREFVIHFSGQNLEDAKFRSHRIEGQIQTAYTHSLSRDLMAIRATFSKNKKITSMPIGVSAGQWETQMVSDGKREISIALYGGEAIFRKATETNGKSRIPVMARGILDDDGRQLWENRIIAKDSKGNILTGKSISGTIRGRTGVYSYEFEIPLEQIDSFECQIRPYYWIEFENVALEPGNKTDVQIRINKAGTNFQGTTVVQMENQPLAANTSSSLIVLEGTIIDPEGKPASYDISVLGGGMNTNVRTRSGQDGKFEYSNLPVGEYSFSCNPPNQFEPHLLIKAVQILKDKKTILNVNLKCHYSFSGRVTYEDGSPVVGMEMMAECEDKQMIFRNSVKTDEQGRYTLSVPLKTAVRAGLKLMPDGYTTKEDIYQDFITGREDINFVLIKATESSGNSSNYGAFFRKMTN